MKNSATCKINRSLRSSIPRQLSTSRRCSSPLTINLLPAKPEVTVLLRSGRPHIVMQQMRTPTFHPVSAGGKVDTIKTGCCGRQPEEKNSFFTDLLLTLAPQHTSCCGVFFVLC